MLEEAGSGIEKVVKVNVFITDMANFAVRLLFLPAHPGIKPVNTIELEWLTRSGYKTMNEEYSKWFTHKPARSCVAVKQLPKNVDVEIECIALP